MQFSCIKNMICIHPFHSSVCSRDNGLESSLFLTVKHAIATMSAQSAQNCFGSWTFGPSARMLVRSHKYKKASMTLRQAMCVQHASTSHTFQVKQCRVLLTMSDGAKMQKAPPLLATLRCALLTRPRDLLLQQPGSTSQQFEQQTDRHAPKNTA